MKRVWAILLGVTFVASLIPLEAFSPQAEQLPMCCRRNGAHHCAMSMSQPVSGSGPSLIAKCPRFPDRRGLPVGNGSSLLGASQGVAAALITRPAAEAQTEAQYRVSLQRSHQKRGPPIVLS